ncbi:TPA: hypothetical protein ACH3X2_014186 [Trebouxia sp. C0005]
MSQSSLDLMSGDNQRSQLVQGQVPMGEPKMRKELKEYQQIMQTTVEGALKRFSGDLQRVLEEISRRLELVEKQTEQLGRASADPREVDGLREDAFKERLTAIEQGILDVSRSVQLVRDKQELAGAQAELAAHLSNKTVQGTPVADAVVSALTSQQVSPAAAVPEAAQPSQTAAPTAPAPAAPAPAAPALAAPAQQTQAASPAPLSVLAPSCCLLCSQCPRC